MKMGVPDFCEQSALQRKERQNQIEKELSGSSASFKQFVDSLCLNLPLNFLQEKSPKEAAAVLQYLWQALSSSQKRPLLLTETPDPSKLLWPHPKTILFAYTQSGPFIVDSLISFLQQEGYPIDTILHPVVNLTKEEELLFYVEIGEYLDAQELQILLNKVEFILQNIQEAVQDWAPMRSKINDALFDIDRGSKHFKDHDKAETQGFLQWLDRGYFTFLAYRDYDNQGQILESLGVLKNQQTSLLSPDHPSSSPSLPSETVFHIGKTKTLSMVHRLVPMDVIIVKKFDESGAISGERQFFGLFTSTVYTRSIQDIPLLRRKAEEMLSRHRIVAESRQGKLLLHILESFPRDELFQADLSFVNQTVQAITELKEKQHLALFVRHDSLGHLVSCLIYIPKDRFNSHMREQMAQVLASAFQGSILSFKTEMGGDLAFARVHFLMATPLSHSQGPSIPALEEELHQMSLTWEDRFKNHILRTKGSEARLFLKSLDISFSAAYKEAFSSQDAVDDLENILQLQKRPLVVTLKQAFEGESFSISLKLYQNHTPIILSDVLPILENMSLRVTTETPYLLQTVSQHSSVWLHHFRLDPTCFPPETDFSKLQPLLEEALVNIRTHKLENDRLNALMIVAGFSGREISLFRAYFKYLKQIYFPFDLEFFEKVLARHKIMAKGFLSLFYTLFSPKNQANPHVIREKIQDIEEALKSIEDANDDKILRSLFNLITSTLRTNYFKTDETTGEERPFLSFKFDCASLADLPLPKPAFEIFVYAPWVEAVHLRGGKVARGGIRWSNRLDFRKEVLDLMKAQMVKNTVIVPVGAKGGFFVKNDLEIMSHEERQKHGIFCYQTMVRGLLDVTDTLVEGKRLPPKDVACLDESDPYLVVAADKGTATFSDIANQLSLDYDFWLKDAFASGGSAGYDHKKMAITSRGAWISVTRHFKEQGLDVQKDSFTVVGVGDMSGDVFGNGMLLSKKIQLVAAFNHTHIFLDPNPDEEKSFKERQRLFALPRSNWNDYDPKALSKGGFIVSRLEKTITITPEIQIRFGIEKERISPDELMRLLLASPVDLLWFGGIGTFVKASTESHDQAGDRLNDSLRIDAKDLKCLVIGEGANLGMTQKARIEYAAIGGHLNTDAIDNSGGVDCSDHEVNIKILLQDPEIQKSMSLQDRNLLLADMTDEVASLTLRSNELQTQAISVIQRQGVSILDRQRRFIQLMEKQEKLRRDLESLPTDDLLKERRNGLTRPEIAIVLAYGKMFAFDHIIQSGVPDSPLLLEDLHEYFPKRLAQKFSKAIDRHPLKREIVATFASNHVVNRMGPTFLNDMMAIEPVKASEVIRAYFIVVKTLGLDALWKTIEQLPSSVPSDVQYRLFLKISELVERNTLWLLKHPALIDHLESDMPHTKERVHELMMAIKPLVKENIDDSFAGIPEDCIKQIILLPAMNFAYGIMDQSRHLKISLDQVVPLFFEIQRRCHIEFLLNSMNFRTESSWERKALYALRDRLVDINLNLVASILKTVHDSTSHKKSFDAWCVQQKKNLNQFDQWIEELKGTEKIEFSMLFIASRYLEEMM